MNVFIVEDEERDFEKIVEILELRDPDITKEFRDRGLTLRPMTRSWRAKSAGETREQVASIKKAMSREGFDLDLVILDLYLKEPGASTPATFRMDQYFELFAHIRQELGPEIPIVIYSWLMGATVSDGSLVMQQFLEILRDRRLVPPNEVLNKDKSNLAIKIAQYMVDLSVEDEQVLKNNGILVPRSGAIRKVLRKLKQLACSAGAARPSADVLLLGENGVGKTTFARAYHLLRPRLASQPRLGMTHLDLGSLDIAGSAPNIALFGATEFNGAWSLGAFSRATLYHRDRSAILFPTQQLDLPSGALAMEKELGAKNYPRSEDTVSFSGSGTLFLDEVVNISKEIQMMLLQALSYDSTRRHIYTTGLAPRRLHVGPSLVFATAQDIPGGTDRDPAPNVVKDYWFRIDQQRVSIPPLRERDPVQIFNLLVSLIEKRNSARSMAPPTHDNSPSLDPVASRVIRGLALRNNVVDLQRIVDQMEPEDNIVTWRHVASLFERERPISSVGTAKPEQHEVSRRPSYSKVIDLLNRIRSSGRQEALSKTPKLLSISRLEAYYIGLAFMDSVLVPPYKRWPSDQQVQEVFGHGAQMFRTYLHRLSPHSNGSFSLTAAISDLEAWKSLRSGQEPGR